MPARSDGVFINVPFDRRYKKLFDALVFAVHDCGFVARCAREQDDGSQIRLEKLYTIIAECRYGIHDLSRTTLDRNSGAETHDGTIRGVSRRITRGMPGRRTRST
jgi:hypothetical protein